MTRRGSVSSQLRRLLAASAAWFYVLAALPLAAEPANLGPHKAEIRAYVDTGVYLRDVAKVAGQARTWLEQRARLEPRTGGKPAARLAIVLDLDETLFFNWPQMAAQDLGYVPDVWEKWVESAAAPPLEPVRDLYWTARRLKIAVIFLSSRPERQRAATERNLRAIECGVYESLILQADDDRSSNAEFKQRQRARLTAEGFAIVANVGDQDSDLAGGGAERSFKLPNPFYLTE